MPGGQGGGRVGQRPDQVPLHHGVEGGPGQRAGQRPARRAGRVAVHGADGQPEPGRLGPQGGQHPGGQVQRGDVVSLAGQQQGEESGSRPGVEHPCGRGGQQAAQRAGPGRRLLRPPRAVRLGVVIGSGVVVPELPDLVGDAGGLHAALLLVVPGARRRPGARRGAALVAAGRLSGGQLPLLLDAAETPDHRATTQVTTNMPTMTKPALLMLKSAKNAQNAAGQVVLAGRSGPGTRWCR